MSIDPLLGQEAVQLLFKHGIQQNRLSASLLFYGHEDSGKFTAAIHLAKMIHCTEVKDSCCNVCPICKKIDHFTHPDVFIITTAPLGSRLEILFSHLKTWNFTCFEAVESVVNLFLYRVHSGFFALKDRVRFNKKDYTKGKLPDLLKVIREIWSPIALEANEGKEPSKALLKKIPELVESLLIVDHLFSHTNISIDAIRKVLGHQYHKSNVSNHKVFIIDDLVYMKNEAVNAFLKGLEEPPDDTQIILITENEHKILPTIRSRCFMVPFKRLSKEDVQTIVSNRFGVTKEIHEPLTVWEALSIDKGREETRKILLYFFTKGILQFRRSSEMFQLIQQLLGVEGVSIPWVFRFFLDILKWSLRCKYQTADALKASDPTLYTMLEPTLQIFSKLPDMDIKQVASRIEKIMDKVVNNNVNPALALETICMSFGHLYLGGQRLASK